MAVIGALGKLSFKVSEAQVRTFSNFQWSGAARYGTHQRHGGNALTEFTGLDADQISLDLTFNAQLGTSPISEIWQLWNWQRKGTTLPLDDRLRGNLDDVNPNLFYQITMTFNPVSATHWIKARYFDVNGDIYHAVVTVKLQEYLRK